jgi:hypothetical protein
MKKAISTAGLLAIVSTGIYTSAAYADGVVVVGADAPPAVVVTPSTNCSSSSPCGNYAVVNSNNEVTNIIVCQAAVCGGGSFGGQTLVLQTPTDPNGSGWSTGGYLANNNGRTTYDPSTQTFIVPSGPQEISSVSTDTKDTLSAYVSDSVSTFQAPKNIVSSVPKLSAPKATKIATGAISATRISNDGSSVTQSQTFSPGLSHDQMMFLINSNLQNYLITANSESLIHLLFTLGY